MLFRSVTEDRVSIVKSTKRFVAIDRELAQDAEDHGDDTIKNIVENLLRSYVSEGRYEMASSGAHE